ncbi:hypothetical protein LJC46_00365 [Desulfovibrio sp. OttesenSCG-928-G15]|nr:hypothetical protein [Desulfovibrio sp. OttesenSCG-928-G15]
MACEWAALLPHPPVIVSEVGKGREKTAAKTLQGFTKVHNSVQGCAAGLEALVVLSPHAPYVPDALFVNTAPSSSGNFSRFGAPALSMRWSSPGPLLQELASLLKQASIPAAYGQVADVTADHGAMVPLRLLESAFLDGRIPPVIHANPSGLTHGQALALGQVLALLAKSRSIALLASGDLSHKLKEDGPYGFHPAGPVFDKAVVDALEAGSPDPLLSLAPDILENAAECGLRPCLALLGLCKKPLTVFSCEGPFGVGYCTAFTSSIS